MGLDAQVIGIGPFSRAIVDDLDYPARYYDDVPAGATVITTVFAVYSSSGSRAIARCFGVGAMELGRHALGNAASADVAGLQAEQDSQEEVAKFLRLREAGFHFYYMPNA